jgi:hypothetical protein
MSSRQFIHHHERRQKAPQGTGLFRMLRNKHLNVTVASLQLIDEPFYQLGRYCIDAVQTVKSTHEMLLGIL